MSSGGGTTSTNTIQNSDPWSGVQPYMRYGLGQALNQYNRGPYGFSAGQGPSGSSPFTLSGGSIAPSSPGGSGQAPYYGGVNNPNNDPFYLQSQGGTQGGGTQGFIDPGAFLAGQSPATLQALQMQQQIATDPNSLTAQAQRTLGGTISGQYLNPGTNPAWDPMSRRISDAYSTGTAAQTDAAAARANALGGSGYNQQTQLNQRALGDSLSGLAGGLYNTERGYQMNALGMAPGMDLARSNMLSAVGSAQDARAQAELQARQQAYMSPWSNLAQFRNLISGTGGGSTSGQQTSPYFTNPAAQYMGYGIGGLALYNMLSGLSSAPLAGV
jgi:hypothetical protein